MSGAMMEFRITSDLQELRQQTIEANFEETKAWLTENLEPLRTMAVTAESMSQCKQYRAATRKIRDRIDESRKMAKAAALEAYSGFEAKCKELTALCDEAAGALDAKIKAMEETAKQEKKARLSAYFAQAVGDMAEWLTFGDCFNPKWLNATCAETAAQTDIHTAIEKCRADLNAIRALHSEFEMALLDEYTRTRNISAVLVKNETLGRMKAAEEERKRKEAEMAAARAAAEQQAAAKAAPPKPEAICDDTDPNAGTVFATAVVGTLSNDAPPDPADETEYTVDFRVFGTAAQLNGLKTYMKENGIRYGRVPQK